MSNALARARVTIDLAVAYQDLLDASHANIVGDSADRSLHSHGLRLLLFGELTRVLGGALRSSDIAPFLSEPDITVALSSLREP